MNVSHVKLSKVNACYEEREIENIVDTEDIVDTLGNVKAVKTGVAGPDFGMDILKRIHFVVTVCSYCIVWLFCFQQIHTT